MLLEVKAWSRIWWKTLAATTMSCRCIQPMWSSRYTSVSVTTALGHDSLIMWKSSLKFQVYLPICRIESDDIQSSIGLSCFFFFLVCRGREDPWPDLPVQRSTTADSTAEQGGQQAASGRCHRGHLEVFPQPKECDKVCRVSPYYLLLTDMNSTKHI